MVEHDDPLLRDSRRVSGPYYQNWGSMSLRKIAQDGVAAMKLTRLQLVG